MSNTRSRVLGYLMLAVALLVLPASAGSAQEAAPDAKEYARVELSYADGACAADPEVVTISWGKHPNKVVWVAAGGSGYYWDIVWKGGDEPNYFGKNFDIRCGKERRRSNLPGGRVEPGAKWPYAIAVYACDGQQKGEKLCEVDPGVDWDD